MAFSRSLIVTPYVAIIHDLGTWERVEYIYGFSIGEREGA
jgi:hypothetical protein